MARRERRAGEYGERGMSMRDEYNSEKRHDEKYEKYEREEGRSEKRSKTPMLNSKSDLFGLKQGSFRMPMEKDRSVEWSPYCDQVGMVDERNDETVEKINRNQRKMFY